MHINTNFTKQIVYSTTALENQVGSPNPLGLKMATPLSVGVLWRIRKPTD